MPVRHLRRGVIAVAGAVVALVAAATPALAHDRGAVYTLSNQPSNAVVQFERGFDGSLTQVASFLTGGAGTGAGLGSQGALDPTHDLLLAVNAGSDELSVFRIQHMGCGWSIGSRRVATSQLASPFTSGWSTSSTPAAPATSAAFA